MSSVTPRRNDGRRRDGPVPLAEALQAVAGRLGMRQARAVATVFGSWDSLVGPALAAHVRPVQLLTGTLVVSVDHPAWATEVRRITPELLARLAEVCEGPEVPERIEVRVRRAS